MRWSRSTMRLSLWLCVTQLCLAMKDRDTFSPSSAPSTLVPLTSAPSKPLMGPEKSLPPSNSPTAVTTHPSAFPSTASPSKKPVSSSPTVLPTTLIPTQPPTELPSPYLTWLAIPKLELTLAFAPGTNVMESVLNQILEDFFFSFLSTTAPNRNHLDSVVLQTTLNYSLGTGVGLSVTEGSASYVATNRPGEEDWNTTITTYFAYWGEQDLKKQLYNAGLPVQSMVIRLDGATVASSTDTNNDNDADTSSSSSDSALLIIIVAVVLVVVFLSLGFLVWYWFIRRRQPDKSLYSGGSDADTNHSPLRAMLQNPDEALSPLPISPRAMSPSLSSDDMRSFSGLVSLEDESLFTNPMTDLVRSPPSNFQYDPSRLDSVISSAKGFAQQHHVDEEKGPGQI